MPIADGRALVNATVYANIMEAATTHQKVTFRRLSEEDKKKALEALDKEVGKLRQYEAITTVSRDEVPSGAKIIDAVVVFTKKRTSDGVRAFKAR